MLRQFKSKELRRKIQGLFGPKWHPAFAASPSPAPPQRSDAAVHAAPRPAPPLAIDRQQPHTGPSRASASSATPRPAAPPPSHARSLSSNLVASEPTHELPTRRDVAHTNPTTQRTVSTSSSASASAAAAGSTANRPRSFAQQQHDNSVAAPPTGSKRALLMSAAASGGGASLLPTLRGFSSTVTVRGRSLRVATVCC